MVEMFTRKLLDAVVNFDIETLKEAAICLKKQKFCTTDQMELVKSLERYAKFKEPSAKHEIVETITKEAERYFRGSRRFPLYGGFDYKLAYMQNVQGNQCYTTDGLDLVCCMPEGFNKIVLFFHGNGSYIEEIDQFYVDLYKSMGYGFCAFNYRGYGNSRKGNISIPILAKDAETVYLFLRDSLGIKNIGIHGLSMGGFPAVRLGSRYHQELQFVVAEKTFRSTEMVAGKTLGNFLGDLLMRFTGQGTGDLLYLWRQIKCKKVLTYSECDEVIVGDARLIDDQCPNLFVYKNGSHTATIDDRSIRRLKEIISN
jgi:Serine aminopeptidase, S33